MTPGELGGRTESKAVNIASDEPNAADLTLAPFVLPVVVDPSSADLNPLLQYVAKRVRLAGRFAKTHAWVERVMAIDHSTAAV